MTEIKSKFLQNLFKREMILKILIIGLVNAGHQIIKGETGASFEEIDDLIHYDHELRVEFLSPIVVELPDSPSKGKVICIKKVRLTLQVYEVFKNFIQKRLFSDWIKTRSKV